MNPLFMRSMRDPFSEMLGPHAFLRRPLTEYQLSARPTALGEISLKSVAASVGVEPSKLLLLAGGGLLAGYALNSMLRKAGRSARRAQRKTMKAITGASTKSKVGGGFGLGLVTAGIVVVGGYWLYRQVQNSSQAVNSTPRTLPARTVAPIARKALPAMQNGHWTRPA